MMAGNVDKPLLTLRQVREWEAARDRLVEEIKALNTKKARLERKIAAAAEFMDGEGLAELPVTIGREKEQGVEEALPPMTEAVERILAGTRIPLNLKQVKAELNHMGYPKKRLGNYFYTVMRRLHEHDRIVRSGDTFTAPARSNGASKGDD